MFPIGKSSGTTWSSWSVFALEVISLVEAKTFVSLIVLMYVILLLKGARSRFTCSFSNKPEVSHFIPLVDSYTLPSLLSAVVAYNLLLYDNIEEGRLFLNGFSSKEFETHDIAFPFCAIYTLRTLSTTE